MPPNIAEYVPWILRPTKIQHTLIRPLAQAALWIGAALLLVKQKPVGVDRLQAVLFINLKSRPDRLAMFNAEMDRLRITARRVEATADPIGAIGCLRSHIVCLDQMLEQGWESMMVCEDDALFKVSRRGLDVLVDAFLDDRKAEVACLSFHLQAPPTLRNLFYFRSRDTQTMACYLVKQSVAAQLLALFEHGADELRRGGDSDLFAADRIWKQLQGSHVFLVSAVRAVVQADGFSDIEGREVSYRM